MSLACRRSRPHARFGCPISAAPPTRAPAPNRRTRRTRACERLSTSCYSPIPLRRSGAPFHVLYLGPNSGTVVHHVPAVGLEDDAVGAVVARWSHREIVTVGVLVRRYSGL